MGRFGRGGCGPGWWEEEEVAYRRKEVKEGVAVCSFRFRETRLASPWTFFFRLFLSRFLVFSFRSLSLLPLSLLQPSLFCPIFPSLSLSLSPFLLLSPSLLSLALSLPRILSLSGSFCLLSNPHFTTCVLFSFIRFCLPLSLYPLSYYLPSNSTLSASSCISVHLLSLDLRIL